MCGRDAPLRRSPEVGQNFLRSVGLKILMLTAAGLQIQQNKTNRQTNRDDVQHRLYP